MNESVHRLVGATSAEVAEKAGLWVLETLAGVLRQKDEAVVVLSGGNTPKPLYKFLTKRRDHVEWERVLFFFGDERCVPPSDPRSNYRMALETFLAPLRIPAQNIFRIEGELSPPAAAEKYERIVKRNASFDLVLLGLGPDGHTASLFPGSPVLEEDKRLVRPAQAADGEMRITFTPLAFRRAERVLFLVTGPEKSEALYRLFSPDVTQPHPARRVLSNARAATIAFDRSAGARLLGPDPLP